MARDWETWLRNSIGPASATEEQDRDRTEKRIRDAILASPRLAGNVRVFVKGSYANGTNVRRDSDVDVAVEWKRWSYISRANAATSLSWEELGTSEAVEPLPPEPPEYRTWVEAALVAAFGHAAVNTDGNKAITVAGGSTTLDADVVPCFKHKRYTDRGVDPSVGIRLYPRTGRAIENWPEQHRINGIRKNDSNNTRRRYKEIVRALKRLENDMVETGALDSEVHGYFIECLLYNLPNATFLGDSYRATTTNVLAALWHALENDEHDEWVEVNGRKWLWYGGQTWTPEEASRFAYAAWNYINAA